MPRTLHTNMTRGEVTPLMQARVDSDLYEAGLKTASGVVVQKYGGVTRTPGFMNLGSLEDASVATYIMPFIYNAEQVYAVELGDEVIRFWTRDGQVMDGGSPYEVVSPYAAADTSKLFWYQRGDVMYLACEGYPPKTLTRSGETDWAFADYDHEDGPFLDINTTGTSLTPADYGSVTPQMTSDTTPWGTAACATASAGAAWNVFDKSVGGTWLTSTGLPCIVSFTFDNGAPSSTVTADAYWIKVPAGISGFTKRVPSEWKFQGYDGSDWVTLDSRTGETGWVAGERRYYEFINDTAYEAYRLYVTANEEGTTIIYIDEIGIHQEASEQTAFNLTASSISGINDGAGFQTTDEGRLFRLLGTDGKWRWGQIVSRSSTTVVTVRIHDHALPDLDAVVGWRLGAWSGTTGYPASVTQHEDRIGWARTDNDPFTGWLTRAADYDSFRVSDPVLDDDAVTVRPNGSERGLNPVNWILGGDDLFMGTSGVLDAVGPRDEGRAFGPENVRRLNSTKIAVGALPAIGIGQALLAFDLYGKTLYELIYSVEADGYIPRELSILQEHLFRAGVVRYAFQQRPHSILWCVTASGSLLAVTYDRDQKIFGVTRRPVDGTVSDVAVLPNTDDGTDDVFITVRRTVNGSTVARMEIMAPFYRSDTHDYPVYYDAAKVVTGTDLTGVSTASHLEGKTVGVWADGVDLGDATVSGGAFTLPGGGTADTIVYGLRNAWEVENLKIAVWGSNDGPSLGYPIRIGGGKVHLFESAGLEFGSVEARDDFTLEDGDDTTLRTGDFALPPPDDRWADGGRVSFGGDKGYPVTILGMTLNAIGAD